MAKKLGDPPYTSLDHPDPILADRILQILDRATAGPIDDVLSHPEQVVRGLSGLEELINEHGFVQALSLHLDSDNDLKRCCVAMTLVALPTIGDYDVPKDIVERSKRTLTTSLDHPLPLVRVAATGMLVAIEPPPDALKPLRNNLKDPKLATLSAIALSRSREPEMEALRVLVSSLYAEDSSPELAALAATALLRMGLRQHNALDAIHRQFNKLPSFALQSLLAAIHTVGPAAAGLFDQIAAKLADRSQPSLIRYWSAAALGSISRGTNKATPFLLEALRSTDDKVVEGAAFGLEVAGNPPPAACEILAVHLNAAHMSTRLAAAEAVHTLAKFAAPLILELLSRLADEPDPEVRSHIARALAAIGKPAAAALIASFDDASLQMEEDVSIVLASMGQEAAETINDVLPTDNQRKLQILLNVLENMGSNAAPAIPSLTDIFQYVDHEHLLLRVARIFFFCGPKATQAIPALITHITERYSDQNDVDFWVKQTLLCHPIKARDELRKAMPAAIGAARRRLEIILSQLDARPTTSANRLAGFPNVIQIRQFVLLGDVLIAHGACSLRNVGELLKTASPLKRGKRRGLSTPTMTRALDTLQIWVNQPLTTPRHKAQPLTLTAEGKALLQECKEFLASIDRSASSSKG